MTVGIIAALAVVRTLRRSVDPVLIARENAVLREKVDTLQQLLLKLAPMSGNNLKLSFQQGINRTVILGMVDQMLQNKEVNIWWLPDDIERILYVNVISLLLSIMDEVVSGMSINFAGHNVKMQLTYLDVEDADAETLAKLATSRELVAKLSALDAKKKTVLESMGTA